ncbi:MAG: universal stress protein [Actinomycetota bacterium]|jgi:nucleotide-binding universal stress UspA family protein|nr:universal stress protein [Actinomycetota bacterium]MDA3015049.1 universal stress protein [Actinomycetota bacterium]MDA3027168.1 universal stress protein [Actinomycetota bacterium]
MTNHLIALSDGSDFSWRAVRLAAELASQIDLTLEVVEVALLPDDVPLTRRSIEERLIDELGEDRAKTTTTTVLVQGDRIATTIADHITALGDGSIVVMSSAGRGRSAALLGSVAEDLLGQLHGPVLLVGPEVDIDSFHLDGRILVPVDGSATSEYALGLAAAWGIEHGGVPWLVNVVDPDELARMGDGMGGGDVAESSYVARTAQQLRERSHHGTNYDVLHDKHPDHAIARYAASGDVSLIIASTHGRTGLARVAAGSQAMGMVHRSPVPVLLVRPPSVES